MDAIDRSAVRIDDRVALARRVGLTVPDLRVDVHRAGVDVVAALLASGIQTLHHELAHHVTLTPRAPYVEDRGHLDVLMGRSYWGEGNRIDLLTSLATGNAGDPLPRVDVWLQGLDTDTAYVAVIRVAGTSGGNARFRVKSSEGAATETAIAPFDGDGQQLLSFLPAGRDYDMALLSVEGLDTGAWMFYDVTVSTFPG